jgi:NADPH:quinone reductase-like Zn-dependent oxidoreductase
MKAIRVHEGDVLAYETIPDPEPGPGEVLVELRAAALNRRDLLVKKGVYPFPLPVVPGSDGAGVRRDTGEEVVVFPGIGWGDREDAPAPGFEILGGPRDGTYAELIAVPEAIVYPKPASLSWEEAASFPLAAVTAYRALFSRGGLQAGETVLVLGAGSGVTTFVVQLAVQAGARVIVTSSSDEKIGRAKELGADGGVNYATTEDWPTAVQELGPIDLALDSVGSTWQQCLDSVRSGGRVVVFGGTGGTEVTLQVRPIYFKQQSLHGTQLGSPRDFEALLRMLADARWRPVLDSVRPLVEAEAALDRMEAGQHFGKLVLSIG